MASIPSVRLSVIIPTRNCRAWAERCVESVLSQADPVGTEIIVVDDASRDGTADHLEAVFGNAVISRRLEVIRADRAGDRGRMRNVGAERSRGSLLTFLNPEDRFLPGRLQFLEPCLSRHDLIVATREPLGETSDWIRAFLTANWTVPSSLVIRRALFETAGGFAEGYGEHGIPRKVPGDGEYELLLRALLVLEENGKRERFFPVSLRDALLELDALSPPELRALRSRLDPVREASTLARIARRLPRKYWPVLASRLRNAGSGWIRKLRGR